MDFREHAAALRGALDPAPGADQVQIPLTRSTTKGMNIAICARTGIRDVLAASRSSSRIGENGSTVCLLTR
jgi:hypothetical protein